MDGPRIARVEELPAIISLADEVFCGEGGRKLPMGRSFPYMFSEANIDNLYVTCDQGRPVSFIGTDLQDYVACGCRIPASSIGSVCTDTQYRGRGLSSSLLQLAYRRLREKGCLIVMISGSINLYYRTGAAPGVFAMCEWTTDATALQRVDDSSLGLEPLCESNLHDMVELNSREPLRFDWRADWIRTMPLALHSGDMGRGWIVRRGDKAVAAACLGVRTYGEDGFSLVDWFGDRKAVVATLGRTLADVGVSRVHSRMVLQDTDMFEALAVAGVTPERKIPWRWPIKVLDFAALLRALRGHLERTLGDQADAITATECGLRVRAGGCEFASPDETTAVQMVFAVPEVYEEKMAACPEPVRDLLAKAFPIPVRHYGLNFI
ncbi:MAG: GNAT family N-acetyltransferase [Planctomycetes bacterium]|nr:GNAT family N-acetyltransferase [Planctomycetota bacterium]